jgi:hypothetical protein
MHVFICENTPNGILTGVYDAWELKIQERCSHADIYLVSGQPDNYELFCDYHTVAPSSEKAGKVVSTLNRKLGHDFYETILTAILSIAIPTPERWHRNLSKWVTTSVSVASSHSKTQKN